MLDKFSANYHLIEEFDRFLQNHNHILKTDEDKNFIKDVLNFALEAHKNMKRFSGEPYIVHSIEVAKIVTQKIGLGKTSIAAAILHDVPDKTEYTLEDIKRYFGSKISSIVEGLSRIKNSEYFADNHEASVFREIILSMSNDIRVIYIKMADKLHNMRTLEFLPLNKQERIVNEVINIYAPLAHRLGLFEIKSEMEDLCLKYTNPNIYRDIRHRIQSSEREKLQFINKFLIPIKDELDQAEIKYKIQSRAKSIYSIWKKIKQKRVPFKEVYDLYAVRIIYSPPTKEQENQMAYDIANLIMQKYEHKPDRIRDWITIPKETGYQAYHITVKSKDGIWVEVQIRSDEMHRAAEHGLAAHWRYKGVKNHKLKLDEKIVSIVDKLKQKDISADKFMDELKLNFFTTDIYIFTPQGQIINLPKHSTVLDFAFKIHSSIGARALSAKVNGKIVPLNQELNGGDKVQIISAEKPNPQKEWFNYVTTHKALGDLKKLFREERKAHQEKGRQIVEDIYEDEYIYDINYATNILRQEFGYKSDEEFYIAVSENKIDDDKLIKTLHQYCTNVRSRFWTVKLPNREFKERINANIQGIKNAKCCIPMPQCEITAIYDDKNTILVHRKLCEAVVRTPEDKHIKAVWASYSSVARRKELYILAENTKTIIFRISAILTSSLNVNLRCIESKAKRKMLKIYIGLFVKNEKAMLELLDDLSKVLEIKEVKEINTSNEKYSSDN